MSKHIKTKLSDFINESRLNIPHNELPDTLYHVTTNYSKVIESGVLLAKSGLESGGLGGTESVGVSFVGNKDIAKSIYDELVLINTVNSAKNENDILSIIDSIEDNDRKKFILAEYHSTLPIYKDHIETTLMALRLSRNALKFHGKPFYGLVIFHEENIKDKDIGIIEVSKNNIPKNTNIIEGVDKDLGEVRVLGNVYL